MRKLIDADALKAWLWENKDREWADREDLHWSLRDYIDSLPDLGCARGQAHSSTQWCAEVVEMGNRMKDVVAKLEGAKEAHEEMDFGDVDKTWHDGYLDGISIAAAHIRAAIGVEEGE